MPLTPVATLYSVSRDGGLFPNFGTNEACREYLARLRWPDGEIWDTDTTAECSLVVGNPPKLCCPVCIVLLRSLSDGCLVPIKAESVESTSASTSMSSPSGSTDEHPWETVLPPSPAKLCRLTPCPIGTSSGAYEDRNATTTSSGHLSEGHTQVVTKEWIGAVWVPLELSRIFVVPQMSIRNRKPIPRQKHPRDL